MSCPHCPHCQAAEEEPRTRDDSDYVSTLEGMLELAYARPDLAYRIYPFAQVLATAGEMHHHARMLAASEAEYADYAAQITAAAKRELEAIASSS